ncbi:MAG: VCBS repeat-containing protein, partial [Bdellovibrionales bacterium]|nr:VCBS repeat-containing protein [Bdellovibrionales bacterium]
ASSAVEGFYSFPGTAHASGWISDIPSEWQAQLGGICLAGNSSGIPIISRTSVGPSAFVFDPYQIVGSSSVPNPIPTTTLLDFSLEHPLSGDLSNSSGTNDVWTHLSRAVYGFIAPGTRTYVTLGYSGGHSSGVCYKCTQNNGNTCGGYCAPDANDYYQYYWLWDVADLLKVKNGELNPYDVRPYEYGEFPTAIQATEIGGGAFDPASGRLYLTIQRADDEQGPYANPPVVVVYRLSIDGGGGQSPSSKRAPSDWNGDGKTDFVVVRPGEYGNWFIKLSSTGASTSSLWGVPAMDTFLDVDFNGDGRSDQNATRIAGTEPFLAWFHSDGNIFYWGESGDVPVSADFDGDGRTDKAVFRPSTGTWWVSASSEGFSSMQWGLPGDVPLPADFDGDGRDDYVIWRPSFGM